MVFQVRSIHCAGAFPRGHLSLKGLLQCACSNRRETAVDLPFVAAAAVLSCTCSHRFCRWRCWPPRCARSSLRPTTSAHSACNRNIAGWCCTCPTRPSGPTLPTVSSIAEPFTAAMSLCWSTRKSRPLAPPSTTRGWPHRLPNPWESRSVPKRFRSRPLIWTETRSSSSAVRSTGAAIWQPMSAPSCLRLPITLPIPRTKATIRRRRPSTVPRPGGFLPTANGWPLLKTTTSRCARQTCAVKMPYVEPSP